jgi:hypothetical protein
VPGTHESWALAGVALASALLAFPEMRPWPLILNIVRTGFAIAWLAFCVYRTMDVTFWILVGWMLWCAVATLRTHGSLTSVEKLYAVSLVQAVIGHRTWSGRSHFSAHQFIQEFQRLLAEAN